MSESNSQVLTKENLQKIRKKWEAPDADKNETWTFDGVPSSPEEYSSYDYELQEGLASFGVKTFDDLVVSLNSKLGQKINVVDVMGGAYFLSKPENAKTVTGIRIHNKDSDYRDLYQKHKTEHAAKGLHILNAGNRKIIEADLLSVKGWQKVNQQIGVVGELVVCRPVGPFEIKYALPGFFDTPEEFAGLYKSLFGRLMSLVNKEKGVVFTEIPDPYKDGEVADFLKSAAGRFGFKYKTYVAPNDYSWSGYKRRYAVLNFGKV